MYAAPLIGRKNEVNQLMSLVAEAREGRGNGVIVAGAEGMGKSRIVRDVTLRAQVDGARVFQGRCPTNRKTIYAPFFEIFEQMVLAVNPNADVGEEIRLILRPVVASAGPDTSSRGSGDSSRFPAPPSGVQCTSTSPEPAGGGQSPAEASSDCASVFAWSGRLA